MLPSIRKSIQASKKLLITTNLILEPVTSQIPGLSPVVLFHFLIPDAIACFSDMVWYIHVSRYKYPQMLLQQSEQQLRIKPLAGICWDLSCKMSWIQDFRCYSKYQLSLIVEIYRISLTGIGSILKHIHSVMIMAHLKAHFMKLYIYIYIYTYIE